MCVQAVATMALPSSTATARLRVSPPGETLAWLLPRLQVGDRLLLLHHDEQREELLAACWNVPQHSTVDSCDANGCSISTCEGTCGITSDGIGNEKTPHALVARMPLSQDHLHTLLAAFNEHARELARSVAVATSQPLQANLQASAGACVNSAADVATSAKAPQQQQPQQLQPQCKPGMGGVVQQGAKPGGRDRSTSLATAVRDAGRPGATTQQPNMALLDPAWQPAVPVFPQQLDVQWRGLVEQACNT
jgi:hypothetical protein